MYLYETHLHTSPVSACATASIRETLEFYKSIGYAGVFMTEHFIDSSFDRAARDFSYSEKIKHYFSAYEEGVRIGNDIGLDVFGGIEMGQGWAHILVYGIDEEWCLLHPDMDKMRKKDLLPMLKDDGALLIQAHPFRKVPTEICLFPQFVHGVEIFNSARTQFENDLAKQFCKNYGLVSFAGSDNHTASSHKVLGGMATERKIESVEDFKELVLSGKATPFSRSESGIEFLK
ncbi:MAG: histidinol-phosphatase [Clostridia bacterium]|nr:histidinol-phosphatase [Clostridia bacterium]